MKSVRYKDQNKENYKKILIVLFVVIFILLFISLILSAIAKKNEKHQVEFDSISSIKELLEYYDCKYLGEADGTENGYRFDVFTEFKYPLYKDDNTSNEEFYTKLINDAARVMKYYSFRLIDEKNDITIKVKCKNYAIESIIINGVEDYFIYMDSQISMRQYVELPVTDFEVKSPILQACIDQSWDHDINFGTKESIFNNYEIYLDEGIKVRKIQNKVYNLIFTKKYADKVVNNISVGAKTEDVVDVLGKPTFEDEKLDVIGYKSNDFYIFFSDNEISVYRIYQGDTDDFFKLADKLIAEKLDLLDFMNELTYMWPDYSEYSYSSNSFFISYPLKGIEIKLNSSDISGILVYNSIKSSMSKIQQYLDNTNFVARLQIDSVYEAEKRRYEIEVGHDERYNEYMNTLTDEEKNIIGKSIKYKAYPERDESGNIYSMKFIGTSDDRPNRELNDAIDSYLWLSSDLFIYSRTEEAIFAYDLNTGKVQRLLEGKDEFVLQGYEDGILKYDYKEVPIVQY